MACFRPVRAYRRSDGEVVFAERGDVVSPLFLPCGQCVGCRLERSREWAIRCVHEAQMHSENCFVTLTYDDDHLRGWSLDYRDFQLFMKRLRKGSPGVRFYACGEYGEPDKKRREAGFRFGRPHFHACLFNFDFHDKTRWSKASGGGVLYRSAALEALWRFGFASVGAVSFESAAYVARYVMKKINGPMSEEHYREVDRSTGEVTQLRPEFTFMSLKPGIGSRWFDRFQSDVYPHDRVVVRGKVSRPPKYYDRRFAEVDPDAWEELAFKRLQEGLVFGEDNSDERLEIREVVADARTRLFSRKI
jgi:hypothetical protein